MPFLRSVGMLHIKIYDPRLQVFQCTTVTGDVKCPGFGCHNALTQLHRLPLSVQARIEMLIVPTDVTGLTAGARDVLRYDTKNHVKLKAAASRFT